MLYVSTLNKLALGIGLLLAMALSGCATKAPVTPYVKPVVIRPGKIAILPFSNLTDNGDAAKAMEGISRIAFIQFTPMEVATTDEVREARTQLNIASFPGRTKIRELRQLLGVDYLVVGTIYTFVPGDFPAVSLNVRVLDTETGDAVWAINVEKKGKDPRDLFDAGRIRSVHMLAQTVMEEIARSFSRSVTGAGGKEPASPVFMVSSTPPDRKHDVELSPVATKQESGEVPPAAPSQATVEVPAPAVSQPEQPEKFKRNVVPQQMEEKAPPASADEKKAAEAEPASETPAIAQITATPAPPADVAAAVPAPLEAPASPALPSPAPSGEPLFESRHEETAGENIQAQPESSVAPPADIPPAVVAIKEINVIPDGFEIITGQAIADYRTFALSKPPRLVIDIIGAISDKSRKLPLMGFRIKGARIGTYHGRLRVVLDGTKQISPYRIEKTDQGLKVIFVNLPAREKKRGAGL